MLFFHIVGNNCIYKPNQFNISLQPNIGCINKLIVLKRDNYKIGRYANLLKIEKINNI